MIMKTCSPDVQVSRDRSPSGTSERDREHTPVGAVWGWGRPPLVGLVCVRTWAWRPHSICGAAEHIPTGRERNLHEYLMSP